MPRDYKRPPRQPPRASPKRKSQPSRLRWFTTGLVTGVIASVAVLWLEPSSDSLVASIQALTGDPQPRPAAPPPPEAPAKPRFEFYHLLPEMEVAVPEHELVPTRAPKPVAAAPAARPTPTPPAAAVPGQRFLVQVGSFRGREEAERLKATLALGGFESHIQTVAIDGAQTWHRVRLGPFSDLGEVNDARARLRSNGIESMVLKIRS